jgi:hypothetical protein
MPFTVLETISNCYERGPKRQGAFSACMITLVAVMFAASVTHAADSACVTATKEKKLAGAAKNSNVKKCVMETGPAT